MESRITPISCNCPDKGKYPLQGNCLTKGLVYKGIVTDGHQNTGTYILESPKMNGKEDHTCIPTTLEIATKCGRRYD